MENLPFDQRLKISGAVGEDQERSLWYHAQIMPMELNPTSLVTGRCATKLFQLLECHARVETNVCGPTNSSLKRCKGEY